MNTGNVSWEGGGYAGLTKLPLSCAGCHEMWELQPPGTLRACPGIALLCLLYLLFKKHAHITLLVLASSHVPKQS